MNRPIKSEAEMQAFGANLALRLAAGDVIALAGDLGAGKTTLARAIIQALCEAPEVPSPTYTLVQIYSAPEFEIWHCDLYRIERASDILELGLLDVFDEVVSLIEWPQRMEDNLPKTALKINITFEGSGRALTLSGDDLWADRLADV